MLNRGLLVTICVTVVLVSTIRVFGVNRCCSSVANDAACSGCLKHYIGFQERYIHLGSNTTQKCQNTAAPASCDSEEILCVSLFDVDVHDDKACTHVVGISTLELTIPQCDSFDSACGSG